MMALLRNALGMGAVAVAAVACAACTNSHITTRAPSAGPTPKAAAGTFIAGTTMANAADWPVFGHDPARSGTAAGDTIISLGNVRKLHRRWVADLDAAADTAPIFASGIAISRGRLSNMLFETASSGTTYALDAESGQIIWTFKTRGPNVTTSVPALDPSKRWIYAPGVDGYVHKLAAATGVESHDSGFPIQITLMPEIEKDAGALNIANGFLYAVTSGYNGDFGRYHGHVVTVQLSNGEVRVFNSLCSDVSRLLGRGDCNKSKSGIWSRGGAVVDPDPSMHGRVYVTTGNGSFTAGSGGHNYGDSVIALSADGAKYADSYTPTNFDELEAGDTDLGSTAPVMVPRRRAGRTPLLAIQGGKDGILRVLNRERLGGVGGEISDFDIGSAIFTAPAVWQDVGKTWIYVSTESTVSAFQIATDANGKAVLQRAWSSGVGGASPVVANGIVFVATDNAVNAFNARSGKIVWSTAATPVGGSIGGIHWQSPIVVKSWLFISDEASRLTAYSL